MLAYSASLAESNPEGAREATRAYLEALGVPEAIREMFCNIVAPAG